MEERRARMNKWNDESCNPLEDIKKLAEELKSSTGIQYPFKPMTVQEALYHEVQAMYSMGFSSEQVIAYVKEIYELIEKQHVI